MRKCIHSRIVVDPLVWKHFLDFLGLKTCIGPIEVPLLILIIVKFEVKSSAWLFNNTISTLCSTQNKFRESFFLFLAIFVFIIIFYNSMFFSFFRVMLFLIIFFYDFQFIFYHFMSWFHFRKYLLMLIHLYY